MVWVSENLKSEKFRFQTSTVIMKFPLTCLFFVAEELRYVLVSDWDLINHGKSLFTLPAKVTVKNILNDFKKHVEKSG